MGSEWIKDGRPESLVVYRGSTYGVTDNDLIN